MYTQDHPDCEEDWLAALAQLHRSTVRVVNPPRYRQVMTTLRILQDAARETGASLHFEPMEDLGCASISMEAAEFVFRAPFLHAFTAAALLWADNLEVYPLENGELRLSLMFYRVFLPLPGGESAR